MGRSPHSRRLPGRPGFSSLSARSTPRVTSNVLKPGNFSIATIRPGFFADDGVSDQCLVNLRQICDVTDTHGRAGQRHLAKVPTVAFGSW